MSLHQEIRKLIEGQSYISCLLLVHPEINVLTKTVDELVNTYELSNLDIGMALSEALLTVKLGKRPMFVRSWLQNEVSEFTTDPVLITNIDLLFEPSLNLNPLELFRGIGRRDKLIVMWPGEFDGSNLSYGVPEHRNYTVWQKPDIQIFRLHEFDD